MSTTAEATPQAPFRELGLKATLEALKAEVQELYLADQIPWVVGYSGGKDSTAVLQLVWTALAELPLEKRHKAVHVISTDTMVENPVVSEWVRHSLERMTIAAQKAQLPLHAHALRPELKDRFWVNLIGKGYPAPRHKFRWCTERLKIRPSNLFILRMVKQNGEAIVVLGTRKAESVRRGHRMTQLEQKRIRERLSPNQSLPNSYVYSPIENWSNDEVWVYLMSVKNPWGYNNKDLLTMYQGASEDGECPLVIDTSTPSCGDSRFGCWVCTLVDKDRSMSAMIQNNEEKAWMQPLLDLRNALDIEDDRHLRDFRRMAGNVQLFYDRPIPGPYVQSAREDWLRMLLKAQSWIRRHGPPEVRSMELITLEELQEIRRIWVMDKHELEDTLPRIYQEEVEELYPGRPLREQHAFGHDEMRLLREACEGDDLQYEMLREMLDVESQFRTASRRAGLFDRLDKALQRSAYDDMASATQRARWERDALELAREGNRPELEKFLAQLGVENSEQETADVLSSLSAEEGIFPV